jgi:hypothetical protein
MQCPIDRCLNANALSMAWSITLRACGISYAFDDEQAANGICMSNHFRFCIFYRIVPAGGLIERREFDNDGASRVAMRCIAAFALVALAAAHDEPAAVPFDGGGR